MSDIASHHAAHDGQQWKELCRAALAERDPWRLLEGIDAAHNAVLDRIQDRFPTKPLGSEQSDVEPVALRTALATLSILRAIAERQIHDRQGQRKTAID